MDHDLKDSLAKLFGIKEDELEAKFLKENDVSDVMGKLKDYKPTTKPVFEKGDYVRQIQSKCECGDEGCSKGRGRYKIPLGDHPARVVIGTNDGFKRVNQKSDVYRFDNMVIAVVCPNEEIVEFVVDSQHFEKCKVIKGETVE